MLQHPQEAYVGMWNSIEKYWGFAKDITPMVGEDFISVEEELHRDFLLDVLHGVESCIQVL